MRWSISIALSLAATACSDERGLDAQHLPGAVRGLLPGMATEAEVMAAWPEAKAARRDEQFGGTGRVELNDQPAVFVELGERGEAWLVEMRGTPTLALLEVPITDDCKHVLAAMGDRYKDDTCRFTNRAADPGEHRGCTRTAGGTYPISVDCYDRKQLQYWVHWNESTYRHVSRLKAAPGR